MIDMDTIVVADPHRGVLLGPAPSRDSLVDREQLEGMRPCERL